MAKFYGTVGYSVKTETSPGVWKNKITERNYSGDVIKRFSKLQTSEQVNDNIIVTNDISILADPFANENFYSMLYVTYMGAKWKISKVNVEYPRLILIMGEVYNGKSASST